MNKFAYHRLGNELNALHTHLGAVIGQVALQPLQASGLTGTLMCR